MRGNVNYFQKKSFPFTKRQFYFCATLTQDEEASSQFIDGEHSYTTVAIFMPYGFELINKKKNIRIKNEQQNTYPSYNKTNL